MIMNKILVLGIDGASWNLVDDLIQAGNLPTIKKMKTKGVAKDLKSCLPFVTFPAWKCYSTGLNPGKLGYTGGWESILSEKDTI
jgi:predicted AlkP superfamily phosphohydrolase/phosphomutase